MSIKYGRIAAILLICLMLFGITVSADSMESNSYRSYQYNSDGVSTAAPAGYLASSEMTGSSWRIKEPIGTNAKMFCDNSNPEKSLLMFLESNRVVVTDSDMNVVSIYENFRNKNGTTYNIQDADNIVVDKEIGRIYFCFSARGCLTVTDMTGLVLSEITASSIGKSSFSPSSCICRDGEAYIIDRANPNGYYLFNVAEEGFEYVSLSVPSLIGITYDVGGDMVYGISRDGIYELSEGEAVVAFQNTLNSISDFSYCELEERFYVLSAGALYTCDASTGELSLFQKNNVRSVGFAYSSEQLAVLSDNEFKVSFYNTDGNLITSATKVVFKLFEPSDMLFCDEAVYIMDSGNGRVIKVDSDLTAVDAIYDSFVSDGELLDITGAQGIYVKDGLLYIADTNNYRVLISDFYGNVYNEIYMPEQLVESVKVPFRATKLLLDDQDNLYAIADSVNMGAFVFNKDGEYVSFFGSNNVTATSEVILNYIRKKFLTREQMQSLQLYTPITLANFDIDEKGFIYTVTQSDQSSVMSDFSELLRKLNYQGKNTFNSDYGELNFGDVENDRQYSITNTSFCDVDIDKNGFICTLDSSRGKVFQYSSDGQFMTVFGGLGNQLGLFTKPVAVENVGDKIYVLDSALGSITVFEPTEYEKLLQSAVLSLNNNRPDESLEQWYNVLKCDTNNQYAYYGMGIAYSAKGEYEEAMKSFRSANSHSEYSKAFREYRKTYVRDNLWWILLIVVAVIVAIIVISKIVKTRMVAVHGSAYSPLETRRGLPIYVLFHPIDGFSQFRERNMQSLPISIGIVIAFFLIRVISFFFTGFSFNTNKPVDYDLLTSLAVTVLLFALFVVANWAITSFMDGKGKLTEIIAVCAYSITPYLASQLINVVLSNLLTLQESAFIGIITVIGIFWSALLLIMGMATIHEYSFTKTIISLILTVIGMIVIALIIMLFFSLMQQAVSFIYSIWYEIKIR